MLERVPAMALTLTLVVVLTGCATIIQGTTQTVGLSSTPSGAQIYLNNMPLGTTPLMAELKRKDNHVLRIELEGYKPYEATFTRSVSGWVFGNIVFGGIIGLAVDAISGGMYKLTPDQVAAQLAVSAASIHGAREGLFVVVTLAPDAEWERIGELELE